MQKITFPFSAKTVSCYFDGDFSYLKQLTDKKDVILITDENIYQTHAQKFKNWKTIVIKAGENSKKQSTVNDIIEQLILLEADKESFIVGIGGGVVTDITGYVASIYMRGLSFAFVPTTILAMADAAIGGKNGIDVGVYKNLIGLIQQPEFLLFDFSFLSTLPQEEWINGFAEIIKHACIKDAHLFEQLESSGLENFKNNQAALNELIQQSISIKTNIVVNDEKETGERKLLNFGHTFGHAIENIYQLPHGHAVSIGMTMAAAISEKRHYLIPGDRERLVRLIQQYGLPTDIEFHKEKVMEIIKMDKKRRKETIDFILLNGIGKALIEPIPIDQLDDLLH